MSDPLTFGLIVIFMTLTILGILGFLLQIDPPGPFENTRFGNYFEFIKTLCCNVFNKIRGSCMQAFHTYAVKTGIAVITVTPIILFVIGTVGVVLVYLMLTSIMIGLPRSFYNNWHNCRERCKREEEYRKECDRADEERKLRRKQKYGDAE